MVRKQERAIQLKWTYSKKKANRRFKQSISQLADNKCETSKPSAIEIKEIGIGDLLKKMINSDSDELEIGAVLYDSFATL